LRKFCVNPVRRNGLIRAGARGFTSNGVKITVSKVNVKVFAPVLTVVANEELNFAPHCGSKYYLMIILQD